MAASLKPITKKEALKIKVGDMVVVTWSDARPRHVLVTESEACKARGTFTLKGLVYDHGSDAYHVTHFGNGQVVSNEGRAELIGMDDVLIDGWWHSGDSEKAKEILKGDSQ